MDEGSRAFLPSFIPFFSHLVHHILLNYHYSPRKLRHIPPLEEYPLLNLVAIYLVKISSRKYMYKT